MDTVRPETFEFGGFRLDRRRRVLIDPSGAPLRVTAKAFDTLLYFLDHPGQVIDRSTLLEALWPNTVVEENNLSQAVASLRRLLGDGFIVTVTGRGYQFVADVRAVAADEAGPLMKDAPVAPAPPAARWRYAAGLLLGLAVLGTLYILRGDRSRQVARPEVGATTIAVLPMIALSHDREDEDFADGLTEELINRLSRVTSLEVTSRTSSFAVNRGDQNIDAIAQALGVRYVLEGSVARAIDRLRVRVQLVDAATGRSVWSESFDRNRQDAFAIQDEIAGAVSASLVGPLALDAARVTAGGTRNAEAYELYLAARARSPLTPSRRLEQIDRALALDPDFARAWAQKSRLLNRRQVMQGTPKGEAQAASEQAARRAIALDPNLGFAHTALAASLMTRRDRLQADAEFKKGIALGNWEDAEVYGVFLVSVGHISRARDHLLAVRTRDPLNRLVSSMLVGSYEGLGDSSAALAELERGRRLFERWDGGLGMEMLTQLGLGNRGRVRALPQLYPDLSEIWEPFQPAFDALDYPERAAAEVRVLYAKTPFKGHVIAIAAMLGQHEFALEKFLELTRSGAGVGSSSGAFWAHVFRDIRRLPRFKDVVRQEGLVEYWREAGWPDLCRPVGSQDFECF